MANWKRLPNGGWNHRPWWKVAINTILRLLQRGPVKWVIYTETPAIDPADPNPPKVIRYGFGQVRQEAAPR